MGQHHQRRPGSKGREDRGAPAEVEHRGAERAAAAGAAELLGVAHRGYRECGDRFAIRFGRQGIVDDQAVLADNRRATDRVAGFEALHDRPQAAHRASQNVGRKWSQT